jgi:hypothetical protein
MRKIEKELVSYIDAKLAKNGAAQEAIAKKDARRVMVFAAEALVGIREATGKNDGKMVELIQETVGGHSQESWCLSYIMSCIAYAEVKTGIKSPIIATEHCLTAWQKSPKSCRVKKIPKKGALAIWNYPPSSNGHCGIVDEYEHKPGKMMLFEGNTQSGLKADGTIERNGGGTYYTERSTKGTLKMKLLGFLKPF